MKSFRYIFLIVAVIILYFLAPVLLALLGLLVLAGLLFIMWVYLKTKKAHDVISDREVKEVNNRSAAPYSTLDVLEAEYKEEEID